MPPVAASSPDTPLSAAEIQELRRLIADRRRFGHRADPLTATLIGVFAAGFIGWLGYATTEDGKDIVALQVGQEELKADRVEVKAILLEQRRR